MKNITRKIIIIVLAIILTASTVSCTQEKERVFVGEGFSITLDSGFSEKEKENMAGCYVSEAAAVTVHTESFASLQGYRVETPADYAKRVVSANGLSNIEIITDGGLVFFEYQKSVDGKECRYLAVLYKGSRGFWLVQFGSLADEYESMRERFLKCAKSFSAD